YLVFLLSFLMNPSSTYFYPLSLHDALPILVSGLPVGTVLACADTPPFPPQGRGRRYRVVPTQGVGAATASRLGTSGVPRAIRVYPNARAWRARALILRARY